MKNWKIVLLFTVVILFTFSSIVLSGLWKDKSTIRTVELNGNITLSREELFDFAKINDSLICSNQLSLNIIETRLAKHPNIKKVIVLKEGTAVKIDVTEKNPFAAATNGNEMFLVDDQITLYPVKKEHSNIDLPVISGLSSELGPNTYSNNDLNNLKIAQYIISQSIKLNKSLFNYISEINFSDSCCLVVITSDDATPVFLLDYSTVETMNRNSPVTRDINNTLLRRAIDKKLVQLNGFLKQVRVYKSLNSFSYVDLRYKDLVIVKNNTDRAE